MIDGDHNMSTPVIGLDRDGTINLGKLASLYLDIFILIHHPPSQIMKKRNKKVFI